MRDVPLFDGRAELTKEAMNALANGTRRGTKAVMSDGTVAVHDTSGGRVLSTGRGRTDNGLWAKLTSESPTQPGVYAWTEQVGTVTAPGVISWADHPAKLTGTLAKSPAVEKGQKSGLVGVGPVWLRRGPTDPSPGGLGQTWVFEGTAATFSGAKAVLNPDPQSVSQNTPTVLTWAATPTLGPATPYDTDGYFDGVGRTKMTVKSPGIYRVSARFTWYLSSPLYPGGSKILWLRLNGSILACADRQDFGAGNSTMTLVSEFTTQASATFKLSAGDYFEVWAQQNTVNRWDATSVVTGDALFQIEKLG